MADKLSLKWIDGNDLVAVPGTTTSVHIYGYTESPTFDVDNPNFWTPLSVMSGLASGFCERRAVLNDDFVTAAGTTVHWRSGDSATRDQLTSNCMNNMALGKPVDSLFYANTDANMAPIGSAATSNYMTTMDAALTTLVSGSVVYIDAAGLEYASTGRTAFNGVAASAHTTANSQPEAGSAISSPTSNGGDLRTVMAPGLPVEWAKERKWMLDELRYRPGESVSEMYMSGNVDSLYKSSHEPTGNVTNTFSGFQSAFMEAKGSADSSAIESGLSDAYVAVTFTTDAFDSLTAITPTTWMTSNVGTSDNIQLSSTALTLSYYSYSLESNCTINNIAAYNMATYDGDSRCHFVDLYQISGCIPSAIYAITSGFSGTSAVSANLVPPYSPVDYSFYSAYTDSETRVVLSGGYLFSNEYISIRTADGTFYRDKAHDTTTDTEIYAWSSGGAVVYTAYDMPDIHSTGTPGASDGDCAYTDSTLSSGIQPILGTSGVNTEVGNGAMIVTSGGTATLFSGYIKDVVVEPGGSFVFGEKAVVSNLCILTENSGGILTSGTVVGDYQALNSISYGTNNSDIIASRTVQTEFLNYFPMQSQTVLFDDRIGSGSFLIPTVAVRTYGDTGVTYDTSAYQGVIVGAGQQVIFSNCDASFYQNWYGDIYHWGTLIISSGGTVTLKNTNTAQSENSYETISAGSVYVLPGGRLDVIVSGNSTTRIFIDSVKVFSGGTLTTTTANSGSCVISGNITLLSGANMSVDWGTKVTSGYDGWPNGGGGTLMAYDGVPIKITSNGTTINSPTDVYRFKQENWSPFETALVRFNTFGLVLANGNQLVQGWNITDVNFNISLGDNMYAGLFATRPEGVTVAALDSVKQPLLTGGIANERYDAGYLEEGFGIRTFKGPIGLTDHYHEFYVRQFPTNAEISSATSSASAT